SCRHRLPFLSMARSRCANYAAVHSILKDRIQSGSFVTGESQSAQASCSIKGTLSLRKLRSST
ncbi:MAG: hypothetical protein PUH02_00705, partial [bacterium]|nr:hypothetical protein [bacterium]